MTINETMQKVIKDGQRITTIPVPFHARMETYQTAVCAWFYKHGIKFKNISSERLESGRYLLHILRDDIPAKFD